MYINLPKYLTDNKASHCELVNPLEINDYCANDHTVILNDSPTTISNKGNISSRFSINFKVSTSDLVANLEEMFFYYMHSDVFCRFKSSTTQ